MDEEPLCYYFTALVCGDVLKNCLLGLVVHGLVCARAFAVKELLVLITILWIYST